MIPAPKHGDQDVCERCLQDIIYNSSRHCWEEAEALELCTYTTEVRSVINPEQTNAKIYNILGHKPTKQETASFIPPTPAQFYGWPGAQHKM